MFAHEHFKRRLIQLAARHAAALGFALGLFEELIGDGDGGFHGKSITGVIPEGKELGESQFQLESTRDVDSSKNSRHGGMEMVAHYRVSSSILMAALMTGSNRKNAGILREGDRNAEPLRTSRDGSEDSHLGDFVDEDTEVLYAISGYGAAGLLARAEVDRATIQSKIVSIAERIQVGDQKDGADAVRELIEIVSSKSPSNITQLVAEIDARQGVYLAASGTLVQFNAIIAGMLGAAMSLSFTVPLKIILAAPLLLHTTAALLLCWSARPVSRSIHITASKFLSSQRNDVDHTFRNYRRGWRMTMAAVCLSVIAASSYVLNMLGVDLSRAFQTLREITN